MPTFKLGLHTVDRRPIKNYFRVLTYAGFGRTHRQNDNLDLWDIQLDNEPYPLPFRLEEIIDVEDKTGVLIQIKRLGASCLTQAYFIGQNDILSHDPTLIAENENHVIINDLWHAQYYSPSVTVILGKDINLIEPGTRIVAAGHFNRFWDMTLAEDLIPGIRTTTWPLDKPGCWEKHWANLEGESSNFPLFAAWLEFVSQDDPRLSYENRPTFPSQLGVLLLAAKIVGNSVIWEYTASQKNQKPSTH